MNVNAPEHSWIGHTIGPWLVVEPFRTSQRKAACRCWHIELGKVVGISIQRLRRKLRQGMEPVPVDVWTFATARVEVEKDTALRQAMRNAPSFA